MQKLKTGIIAVLFVGTGIALGYISQRYGELKNEELMTAELDIRQEDTALSAFMAPEESKEESTAAMQAEKDTDETSENLSETYQPSANKLNLAYYYPEDAESDDIINSYAGQVFQELTVMDLDWLADLYELSDISPSTMASRLGKSTKSIMGSYNPRDKKHDPNHPSSWVIHDWKKIHVNFIDGDGHAVEGFSNVKDILSMASVYTYFTDMMDVDTFAEYSRQLWKNSHSYSLSMGDLYYCSGCLNKTEEELVREAEEEEFASMGKAAEDSLAVPAEGKNDQKGQSSGSDSYIGNQGVGGYVQGDAGAQVNQNISSEDETAQAYGSGKAEEGSVQIGRTGEAGSGSVQTGGTGEAGGGSVQTGGTGEAGGDSVQTGGIGRTGSGSVQTGGIGRTGSGSVQTGGTGEAGGGSVQTGGTGEAGSGSVQTGGIGRTGGGSVQNDGTAQVEETGVFEDKAAQKGENNNDINQENSLQQDIILQRPESSGGSSNASDTSLASSSETGNGGEVSFGSPGIPESREVFSGESFSENQELSSDPDIEGDKKNPGKNNVKKTQYDCPGHVDLYIRVKILGLKDKKGLFSITKAAENGIWEGWTKRNIASVEHISSQDWFDDYGLSVSSFSLSTPLTTAEIDEYMNHLPADTSVTRRNIIHFALSSVGRVPYYWGGKASSPGYEGNHFGALIPADDKGRMLRGLDCSGWVNWVYWSATGQRLPGESTSSLCLCGEQVSRSELKPGDIIVRTGTGAHVVMFLSWSADGKMNVIHESSASINNVSIATIDAPWPYYRKLVE